MNEENPSVSDFIDRCCISHLRSGSSLPESIKNEMTEAKASDGRHIFSIVKTFEDKNRDQRKLKRYDSDESISTLESSVGQPSHHQNEEEIMTWKTLVMTPF